MKKRIQYISALGLLFVSTMVYSQIKEEKLILNRKRVPEVKKIEKKKTSVDVIKDYPKEEKSENPVQYQITDVPASSDFKTSTISGEDVSPILKAKHQNNYIRLGMGNYGKILGDAYVSHSIDEKNEIGVDAHYLSTSGLKKDYAWDSNQSNYKIGGFLNHYVNTGKWNISAGYQTNNLNYYGIYAMQPPANIDLKQNVSNLNVKGSYDHYSNEILDNVYVDANFLKDDFKADEFNLNFGTNLAKNNFELPIDDLKLDAGLELDVHSIATRFDIQNQNTNSYLKFNASPEVKLKKDLNYIMIGSDISYLNHHWNNTNLSEEQENSKLYWFPKVEVQLAKTNQIKFFAGLNGGLKLNNYQQMLYANPYTLSNQMLKPTQTKYNVYAGLRGDFEQKVKYEVSGNFSKVKDFLFFKANPLFDTSTTNKRAAYDYANTFSATYNDGTLLQLKAGLYYLPLENVILEGDFTFSQYRLDNTKDVLNTPFVNAGLGAKYRLLNNKLLLGSKAFVSSGFTTNSFNVTQVFNTISSQYEYQSVENTSEKVVGYIDFNLSAEYNFYKNFSVFVIGNNLTNKKYETFKGYKTLGAQVLGGLKLTF